MQAGLVPLLLNPRLRSLELATAISDAGASVVVYDASARTQITLAQDFLSARGQRVAFVDLETIEQAQSQIRGEFAPASVLPTDPALILYSSGSTGAAKLVVHSHQAVMPACAEYATSILNIGPDDVLFASSKLFHGYGLTHALSCVFWAGASSALLSEAATPEAVARTVAAHGVTVLCGVPRLYQAMLTSNLVDTPALQSVRLYLSSGEALQSKTWHDWHERSGMPIVEVVGSTEMLIAYLAGTSATAVAGSCGQPVPGATVRLAAEDGSWLVGAGIGTAYAHSDSTFLRYLNDPERTAAARTEGLFRTGDRYIRDALGNYRYDGREDDLFKVNGLWLVPMHVEAVLRQHPIVADAAIINVTRDDRTRVKAVVELSAGTAKDSAAELLRRH
jgi:acyl-coenzyme A synthetase/AMP-(fatty) acid ligase